MEKWRELSTELLACETLSIPEHLTRGYENFISVVVVDDVCLRVILSRKDAVFSPFYLALARSWPTAPTTTARTSNLLFFVILHCLCTFIEMILDSTT